MSRPVTFPGTWLPGSATSGSVEAGLSAGLVGRSASATVLTHLERAERRPSVVMAEMLIVGYRLDLATADDLLAVARPWPGRSSPMRTGRFPDESMRDETVTRWPAAQ